MIYIHRKNLFFSIFIFTILINLVELNVLHNNFFRTIISFFFFNTIPGLLILLSLKIKKWSFFEYCTAMVGLSISLLLLISLGIDILFPSVNLSKNPLSLGYLITGINLIILLLLVIGFVRNKRFSGQINLSKINFKRMLLPLIFFGFPLLTVIGAIVLNNGGPSYISLFLLLIIAVVVLTITILHKKITTNALAFSLYCISLSILFMYSLRSTFVVGFDINTEYKVALFTQHLQYWTPQTSNQGYNAAISVSLLPVLYSLLLKVSITNVLKIIFPILFSFTPVAIFLFLRKYLKDMLAFLGSFFFIAQAQFIQQMPALARQEIAFFFFSLLLLTLFTEQFNKFTRFFLIGVFSISLILSHYSTAYVAISLFLGSYFIGKIYNGIMFVCKKKERMIVMKISLLFVVFFTAFTYFWYGVYNHDLHFVESVVEKTITSLHTKKGNTQSVSTKALLGKDTIMTQAKFHSLQLAERTEFKKTMPWINNYYPLSLINKYPIQLTSDTRMNTSIVANIFKGILSIIKFIIYFCFIIGILYLVWINFVKNDEKKLDFKELTILNIVSFLLIIALVVIPYLSLAYNLERMYQQALFICTLSFILGGFNLMQRIKIPDNFIYVALCLLTLLYFLYNTTFINQVLGQPTILSLNNSGEDYNRFYNHKSEQASAIWLEQHSFKGSPVYTDEYGQLRLEAFTQMNSGIIKDLSPYVLDKYAYVYTDFANVINHSVTSDYDNIPYTYTYPRKFLKDNKNLIYSNGKSEIYK